MPTDGDTARVAPIADVPVDMWAAPSWAHAGTPSNPHETKNQECRGFGEEAAGISAAEASKGGCSIDTAKLEADSAAGKWQVILCQYGHFLPVRPNRLHWLQFILSHIYLALLVIISALTFWGREM